MEALISNSAQKSTGSATKTFLARIRPVFLFSILIWVSHFWESRSFGLYEDDFYRVAKVMDTSWGAMLLTVFDSVKFNDRPLHEFSIIFLSWVGFKLGGIEGTYLIGFLLAVVNAFLFFELLKRLQFSREASLLGAFAYCLFPADTTQAFLTHSLGVQPSFLLLLIALHLYLSGKDKFAYFTAFLTLLIYETAFPLFLLAPLMVQSRGTGPRKALFRHAFTMGILIALVIFYRRLAGERSPAPIGRREVALMLVNPLLGPVTALAMFIYRPIEVFEKIKAEDIMPMSIVILIIGVAFLILLSRSGEEHVQYSNQNRKLFLDSGIRLWPHPLTLGAAMLILAYPLTLTTVGIAISGRGTRVHTAAVLGASLIFAYVASSALRLARARGKINVAILALSSWLTLLAGFGLIVQRDYREAWNFQRFFWSDVVRLCPDLSDGTVILVDPTGLPDNRQYLSFRRKLEGVPDTRQIKYLTYTELILGEVYRFPAYWHNAPAVFQLPIDWKNLSAIDDVTSDNDDSTEQLRTALFGIKDDQVILLSTNNGRMMRQLGIVTIAGKTVRLKQQSGSVPFAHAPLFRYLIRDQSPEYRRYLY